MAAAAELALHDAGIDRAAHVASAHQFGHADAPGFGIDFDLGAHAAHHPEGRDVGRLTGFQVRFLVRRRERAHADDVARLHGKPGKHDLAQRHARAGRGDHRAVAALESADARSSAPTRRSAAPVRGRARRPSFTALPMW